MPITLVLWLSQHCRYSDFFEAEIQALANLAGLPGSVSYRWVGKMLFIDITLPPRHMKANHAVNEPQESISKKRRLVFYPGGIGPEIGPIGPNDALEMIGVWARFIVERSVLVKMVALSYHEADTLDKLVDSVKLGSPLINPESVNRIIEERGSFAWVCENLGRQCTLDENIESMNKFKFLFRPTHQACLDHPGVEFTIFRQYEPDLSVQRPAGIAPVTRETYCSVGRLLAKMTKSNRISQPYLLPNRRVLGPTTLDTDISFLMCNIAEIRKGSIIIDPFCGTGSILIAAAALGAVCFGSDLDQRVLRGWGVAYKNKAFRSAATDRTDVFANFEHYLLPRPDVARAHNGFSPWKNHFADAVITDPPYGIRAMARSTEDTSDIWGNVKSVYQ